jgi:hypothetical protein
MAVNALRIPRLDCADQGLAQPGSVPPQSGFLPWSVPPTNAPEMASSLAPDTPRAIHDRSSRHAASFIKRNCVAIPTWLLESEHFGRETAAFIGARARQIEWRKREEDRVQSATCRSICNLSILNQPVVISSFTPPRVVFRVNPTALSVSRHSARLSVWHTACIPPTRKAGNVAQRSIEILVGRLLTDETFRNAFLRNHSTVLEAFSEAGHELTSLEIAALMSTPKRLWNEFARQIDPRLQKANLRKERA